MLTTFKTKLFALSESQLLLLFTLLAALIAWRIIDIQHGWVNDDSVLYFEVAKLFSIGEWQQGLKLYNWPLYPAILALAHNATGANIQLIAQVLNVLFFTVATYYFLSLIRLAGGEKVTITCGACLLFSTPYIVGDILGMLLRDEGFWAFFLISIVYFVRYCQTQKIQYAIIWQLTSIIALLFRVEGISFLALLPLVIFTLKKPNRLKLWIYANAISLLLVSLLLLALVFSKHTNLADFGRLNEIATTLSLVYHNITLAFAEKAQIMSKQILGGFLDDYGLFSIIISFVAILCVKLALAPGWIASFILASNFRRPVNITIPDISKILYWLMAICMLNAGLILLSSFILSGRYIISLGFIMLIFASFYLELCIKNQRVSLKSKVITFFTISLMMISFTKSLLSKESEYNHEQDAVAWVSQNNTLHKPVFYTSPRERYYAGEKFSGRGYDYWQFIKTSIESGSIQQYDYLVLNISGKHPEYEQFIQKSLPNYQIEKQFLGYKGKKKIIIYVKK